jgi:hypothetical protein
MSPSAYPWSASRTKEQLGRPQAHHQWPSAAGWSASRTKGRTNRSVGAVMSGD